MRQKGTSPTATVGSAHRLRAVGDDPSSGRRLSTGARPAVAPVTPYRYVSAARHGAGAVRGVGMSAVEAVEAEVRELVRRRGLDPITDRQAMRRLVDEVVTHYDERAMTSALAPLPDPRQAARTVYDAVAGFGPLQRHLDDPTVEEIWINGRLAAGCGLVLRAATA